MDSEEWAKYSAAVQRAETAERDLIAAEDWMRLALPHLCNTLWRMAGHDFAHTERLIRACPIKDERI